MTQKDSITKVDVVIKEPKINYKGSFNFFKDYLVFCENGLPVDTETRGFFRRRTHEQHTPVHISLSVLVYALYQCYGSIVDYIVWKDATVEGKTFEYIEDFFCLDTDYQPGSLVRPYTVAIEPELFGCYILDWRGKSQLPDRQELDTYKALASLFGVVIVLTDINFRISTFYTKPAPFGVASFLTKQEWDKFCESLL